MVARPTTFMLGELDILPLYGFDSSCPAMAQGPTRLARGQAFGTYVNEKFGAHHEVKVVPLCGHNARCMYTSEAALPRMITKLESLGCARPVVGLVIPTGYSFNLDGTSIYLTMAAVFIAQATNTPMTLTQELTLLGVLLLTSKGAAGVTGSGFIVLAATLSAVGHMPVAGLALILGIDHFMSEARALTNLIGNGVATIVVAKWTGDLDTARLARQLDHEGPAEADEPEQVLDAVEERMPQPAAPAR